MKDALAQRPVPLPQLLLLIGLLALAVAPHLVNLSPWITGFFYLMSGLRVAAAFRPRLLPGRWGLLALTLLALVNVALNAGVAEGRRGGVALLVAMLGLKLLELRSRRDLYMTVFLGYFVVVTQFLFAQGLPLALYLAAAVVGLTAVLNAMNRADAKAPLLPAFGLALRLLAAAVPAMLVLFLLFPRLGGPLWGITVDRGGAVTGMSDQISPGTISRLSQSRATAFRVQFAGEAPPPSARYWRGLVLWDTDGRTWSPGPPLAVDGTVLPDPLGAAVDYQLTLEPTQQPYLFLLDLPRAAPPQATLSPALTARAKDPVTRRLSYGAQAWPEARQLDLEGDTRERGLWLPHTVTPRMEALVAGWRSSADGDAGVVRAALAHFREQPFVYTLAPPPLGENPEDEFLFDTRRGFCEHYATSFTLLMRIAGIPARVVVGYQGGEYNPRGAHWIIRQSDAHAWSEVWLPGQGWTRVDPTAAVAPERIDYAIGATALGEGAPVIFQIDDPGGLEQLLREMRWLADTLELGWHHWVVGFSRDRQLGLLEDLGLGGLAGYGQALLAVALGILALAIGRLLLQLAGGGSADPLRTAYGRLRRKLARAGLSVPQWLGPRDLQRAAVRAFPEQGGELQRLFDLYIGLRYGRPPEQRRPLRRFRQGVRWLRLPRRAARAAPGSMQG